MSVRSRFTAFALLGLGVLVPLKGQAEGEEARQMGQQLTALNLPLGEAGRITLHLPTNWTVAENDFAGTLPGALQAHHGRADNPFSVLVFTANMGAAPPNADVIDTVAEAMIQNYVGENAAILAKPVLQRRGPVAGLDPNATVSRSYAFIADKTATEGQAQIQLTLIADGTLRYGILVMTSLVEDAESAAALSNQQSAMLAYDLAVKDVVRRVASKR